MATQYRQNITQNVEPAAANVNLLAQAAETQARAAESGARATQAMIKGIADTTGMVVEATASSALRDATTEAEQTASEFLTKGKAAESLAKTEASRSIFAKGITKADETSNAILAGYDEEINRLKEAAGGGMSNEQYVARVDALTRKAIAKFPGLSDKIRERVGTVTGLPYADRWATMQYVRDRFSAEKEAKKNTPEEMAAKDIGMVAPLGTFGTHEELMDLWRTDRATYDQRMRGAKEHLAMKTQTSSIQTNVTGLRDQSDMQADQQRPSFSAIFAGSLGSTVLAQVTQDKEQIFKTTIDLMAKGENVSVNPAAFKTQIDMHAAQMRSNIESARRATYSAIDSYRANNPNISDAKVKELYADADRSAEVMSKQYTDDKGIGLVAMANIMSTYRDKRLSEKTQLVDLAIKQQSAMQNNPLVMQYWAGGEARENLKRTNKDFYSFMESQERELTSSVLGVRNEIKGATDLANVTRVVNAAGQNGAAVQPDPTMDKPVIKASHQALMATAKTLLSKTDLNPTEINIISAAMATSAETGANSQTLVREYKRLGEKISKLDTQAINLIKGNTSNSIAVTVNNINSIKAAIEAKYNTTLTIGANDGGELGVVAPATGLGNRPLAGGAGYNAAAAQEFMKQAKPLLSNIVYGRAMVTGEEPKAIGKEFATLIQNGQAYTGFYNMQPTVETQPAAPTTNTPKGKRAIMSEVAAYAASKKIDLNTAVEDLKKQGYTIGE